MQKFIRSEFSKIGLAPFSIILLALALSTSVLIPKLLFSLIGVYGSFTVLCLTMALFLYYYLKFGVILLHKNIFLSRVFMLSALLLLFWLILIEAAVY